MTHVVVVELALLTPGVKFVMVVGNNHYFAPEVVTYVVMVVAMMKDVMVLVMVVGNNRQYTLKEVNLVHNNHY